MLKTLFGVLLFFFSQTAASVEFEERLLDAAIERTKHSVRYDGSYFSISLSEWRCTF